MNDFPEALSPILVKELRQGLRTRVFSLAFLTLQIVLALFMIAGLGNADGEVITGIFWFLVYLIFLVILPLRGLGSIQSEVKERTLDLVSLTRLSSFRLCFGKWAALFTQSLLFCVAVLPYVFIRYFFGGVDLVMELALLAVALLVCGLFCAIAIALSSLLHGLTRTLIIISFVLFLLSSSGNLLFAGMINNNWNVLHPGYWSLAIILVLAGVFLLTSASATRIASQAENYSTTRRLVILGLTLGSLILSGFLGEAFLAIAYVSVSFASIDVLTERNSPVASVHRPFRRRIWLRPLQAVLSPGWASGTLFLLLLLALTGSFLLVAPGVFRTSDPLQLVNVHLASATTALFPLLLATFISSHEKDPFPPYFYLQIACLAVGGFFLLLSMSGDAPLIGWLGSPLPHTSLFLSLADDSDFPSSSLAVLNVTVLLVLLVLIGRRGRAYRRERDAALRELAHSESP
ncbi:MAG: hypothetical protein AAGJ31_01610 [Verrucomicrobiota bacterium]